MNAREKRAIKFDIYANGEYQGSPKRDKMTAAQAIKLGQTIAEISARTEETPTGRKYIARRTHPYNI